MSLIFRKRIPVNRSSWINLSKHGASVSRRVGAFTFNSRGGVRVRLGKGVSWRIK